MSLISLFLRLMVAHQIADFPLQANWIFRIRQKYSWGPLVHIAPHILVLAILFLPYAAWWQYWANIGILAVTHFIIDKIRKPNIWYLILDQALHAVVMVGQAYLLLSCTPGVLPDSWLVYWATDRYCVWLLAFVLCTFTTSIVLYFIKMTWRTDYKQRGIFGFEKYFGDLFRFLIFAGTALIVCYQVYYLSVLILLPFLFELIYINRKRGENSHFKDIYPSDVIIGSIIAAGMGFWAGIV
jgi:hypothetical protein